MGDAVVDLFLVRISLGITLADTLGDNAGVALGVASVLAVLALHTSGILEEVGAERTAHDVVELLLDKLVSVHLVDFLLALADGTLATQPVHARSTAPLHEVKTEVDLTIGLQVEPTIYWL